MGRKDGRGPPVSAPEEGESGVLDPHTVRCSLVLDSSLLVCPLDESTSDTPESAGEGGRDPPIEVFGWDVVYAVRCPACAAGWGW